MRSVVSQPQHICQSRPAALPQQPFAAVYLHSSRSCSSSRMLRSSSSQAAQSAVTRRPVQLCRASGSGSSSSSKRRKSPASRSSSTAAAPSSSSTTAPTASPVAAAAAASASTTVVSSSDDPSTISIANPPLGFSNTAVTDSNLKNNIVPAAPLVVTPGSRNPEDYSSDEDLEQDAAGYRESAASQWRCLVLDSRYLPVNVVNWARAVVMDLSGKVDVLDYHPGGFAYSAYKRHPLPAVLRVHTFVDVHEFAGRLTLTRKNILLRDHHRCQYCGSSKDLTLDHIIPVCRGGINSWTNLVAACVACNQRKGDKSLAQMGWKLPKVPREPTPQELGVIAGLNKGDLANPPLPWVPYLATFKQMLEKAQRRATREHQQQAEAAAAASSYSSSSRYTGEPGDLVTVTVHPAGPNSKAAKAAAVAAATSGGMKVKASKAKHK